MRRQEIIRNPLITEKSQIQREGGNTITLRVDVRANKIEIKRAVEAQFKVKVAEVRVARVHGKVRRQGAFSGQRPDWKCRAGARYLYIDEFGNVQLCASQLGRLDKPLEEYTARDLKEQSGTYKNCEEGCSVGCAYRCSLVDNDKPQFVKSVLKGFVKGTLRDSSRRRLRTAPVQARPALGDD